MTVTIGQFEYSKTDFLDQGAFGVVFKGRDKVSGKQVAIKKVPIPSDGASLDNIMSEAKILKDVSHLRHSNLVALFECKIDDGHLYMIMQLCDGGNLSSFLKKEGKLDENRVKSFLHQIAAGLYSLNQMKLLHRDLKPANILFINQPACEKPFDKQLKIGDFGLSRHLSDGSMAATRCGTIAYAAPEVLRYQRYDATADLWSVGLITFHCVTGKLPFADDETAHRKFINEKQDASVASKLPTDTNAQLKALIVNLIKIDVKKRISMENFFNDAYFKSGYFANWKKFQTFKSVFKSFVT